MKQLTDLEQVKAFVKETQVHAAGARNVLDINEIPDLSEHNKIFAGSFYYIIDYVASKFTYFSQSMSDLLGICPEAGLAMHPAEYMTKVTHPDDLPAILDITNKFQEFCTTVPWEKLKDLRLVTTFRLKNTKGEYVKIVDQRCIVSYSENKIITKVFDGVSVAAFISEFDIATGVVIDITNGHELISFSTRKEEAEETLTKREIQILRLIAVGFKNKEIAEKLFISVHTVETHRKHIMHKLGIKAPIELVWKALEMNLVVR